jgi:L-alanine-DL-glutamate epimerase-like enolase superfamily enzyme
LSLPDTDRLHLVSLTATVYRAPILRPVRTAFGIMTDRPAVVLQAEDRGGAIGFGEIWCNFPTCGAEHRARLIETFLAPLLTGRAWSGPAEAFGELTRRSRRLALQAGEPGPLAQAIAGVDIALWDLAARRAGQPLWRMLGGAGNGRLPTYASGINPDRAVAQAEDTRAAGFRAFKLKIGFGRATDIDNLGKLRETLGAEAPIAVDANQAWDLATAVEMAGELATYGPIWLEEPLAADAPLHDWRHLAAASPIPLAAGENLRGEAAFDEAIGSGALGVIQPDVAKWGGITGCLPLARRIVAAGLRYCPHWLGGGIGLMASAHLLAVAGGDGLLEVDSNPNPLREGLAMPFPELKDGRLVLPDRPGLGIAPDPEIERFAVPLPR